MQASHPDPEMEGFEQQLGKTINELQTLELLMRVFLHNNRPPDQPRADLPMIENASVGSRVPLNAFTNYDSLKALITSVNAHPKAIAARVKIDGELVTLRDALAHGRKYANQPALPFRLIKFGKPDGDQVVVEFNAVVSIDWMMNERKRVLEALEKISLLAGVAPF